MATPREKESAAAKKEIEANKGAVKLDWEGTTLTLPPHPQWGEILCELPLIRKSNDPTASLDMLTSLIGEQPYRIALGILKEKEPDSMVAAMVELAGEVFSAYGSAEG